MKHAAYETDQMAVDLVKMTMKISVKIKTCQIMRTWLFEMLNSECGYGSTRTAAW